MAKKIKGKNGNKKPKFKCKSEAQKRAIWANYSKNGTGQKSLKQQSKSIQKDKFQLPFRDGGRRWQIFKVPDFILNGKQDNSVHGGLVIDEENDNFLLVQVTHSEKKGKRNNISVRNLVSTDLDENGNLKNSFLERRLIVSFKNGNKESGIDIRALNDQMNDLQFTETEKREILAQLSNLSTAEEKYKKFIDLANKKNDTQ